jgi:hypothetical protein
MATVTQPRQAKPEPRAAAAPPAARTDPPPALPAPPAPWADEKPTWGDGIAMRIWLFAFFLMGGLLMLDLLIGLLHRGG